MNRTLSGGLLTTKILGEIAIANNLLTEKSLSDLHASNHDRNLFRSRLLDLTAKARHKMWARGELEFRTQLWNHEPIA